MYQFWRPKAVERERSRIHQTWFDYRHIHPVLRSFVFIREFDLAHQRAYRRYYGEAKDGEDSPRNVHVPLYRRKPKQIVMTINMMHVVDELGFPYDSFFDAAFDYVIQDRGFQGWTSEYMQELRLPPLSVLVDAGTAISAAKAFERRNIYRMRLPEHPHYRAENWRNTYNQRSCAKWLINMARQRGEGDRLYTLARLVYEAGLLRENEIA